MILKAIGVLAGCASAGAFILPPGVAVAPASSLTPGSLSFGVDPKARVITVPCPSCALPYEWTEQTEDNSFDQELYINSQSGDILVLSFTVSADGQQLLVNDHRLYPPYLGNSEPLRIQQVPHDSSLMYTPSGDFSPIPLIATTYGVQELAEHVLTPTGDVLKTIRFSIRGINDNEVRPDEVEVRFLRTSDGEILIMDIATIPVAEGTVFTDVELPPSPPFDGPGRGCGRLPATLCRLKDMVNRLTRHHRAGKGCHGRARVMPGHIRPEVDGSENDAMPEHRRPPPHMRPHHGRHGHHGHHRHGHGHHLMRAFVRAFMAILVPVMAGIAVGMFVSLTGLVVGRFVGFIWVRLVRGGRPDITSVETRGKNIVNDDANKSLLAEMEAPPSYEDEAPPYEDLESKAQR